MTKLYVRLWLAVVATVLLLSVLFFWAGRIYLEQRVAEQVAQGAQSGGREPALRELTVRDEKGQTLGSMQSRPVRLPGRGVEYAVGMQDGSTIFVQIGPRINADGSPAQPRMPLDGAGQGNTNWPDGRPRMRGGPPGEPPEFMSSGPFRQPMGLVFLVAVIGVAVAVGAYPVMRRLTQRLEALKKGVERFGDGNLSTRVEVKGRDEIAFLAQQFNESAGRIERLVASHKDLLANASHELRSPLTRIRMGIELSQTSPSEALLLEMRRSLEELDQLIDEILLASRLDAQGASVGPMVAVDWLGLVAEECAAAGIELDVGANLSGTTTVLGVPKLLRRVVRNLLENAKRYGGEQVQVQFALVGHTAVVQVTDSGPGVAPPERERIFEPFYRLPGASESSGGVGLGLALVRSIALRHGGGARCIDKPSAGSGACFEVSLPLQVERFG